MMESDDLQLAIAYADLAQSIAFRDFLDFQNRECDRLENIALNWASTDCEGCRSAIIAWQQRRLVVKTLEETVRDSAERLRQMEIENVNNR